MARPIAARPDQQTDEHLHHIAAASGMELYTLRQRLVGTAPVVLATHHDAEHLAAQARSLLEQGVSAWVVAKADLTGQTKPQRCTRLELRDERIHFLGREGHRLTTLQRGQPCLLVLGALDFRRFQHKLLARQALRPETSLALDEALRTIFANDPVLDVYLPEARAAVRIHGRRFDFTCLGERNRLAVGSNFPTVLEDLQQLSTAAVLDTDFGSVQHPFLTWPEPYAAEPMLRQFDLYSRFVHSAYRCRVFEREPEASDPLAPLQPPAPGGLLWTGIPLQPVPTPAPATPQRAAIDAAPAGAPLPPPPAAPRAVVTAAPATWTRLLARSAERYRQWARALGAPKLLQPLLLAAAASFAAAPALSSPLPLPAAVTLLGAATCVHAFVLLLRRRTIQNCPTAKIRSLPMGEVETTGHAAQKYFLKSPFTGTDCVYYSYEVYERATTGNDSGYVLTRSGHSGRIPFYLRDDPHLVLVLPAAAVIHAGTTQTLYSGGLAELAVLAGQSIPPDAKVIERVIAAGERLYVMGYAHRRRHSADEQHRRLRARLRALKADPERLAGYDRDGDGRIDAQEWDTARRDAEEATLLQGAEPARRGDEVAIGEHPAGGLFYISDQREETILRSLNWQVPVAMGFGAAALLGGGFYFIREWVRAIG